MYIWFFWHFSVDPAAKSENEPENEDENKNPSYLLLEVHNPDSSVLIGDIPDNGPAGSDDESEKKYVARK